MEIQKLYSIFLNSKGGSTDTRTLKKGTLFFALSGPNFDGNQYAENAIEKGASFVVVDKLESIELNSQVIFVKNTLTVLQKLATVSYTHLTLPTNREV